MKTTNQLTAIKMASIVVTAIAVTSGSIVAQGNGNGNAAPALIPTVPSGWLSAYPTMVQTGTHPTLSWAITHPSNLATYTTIAAPATLTTLGQLDVDIRVIGAGVTTGSSSGNNTNWVATEALVSVDGGAYKSLFYGVNTEVNPNALVWSKRVNNGTEFRFAGRHYAGGAWSTTYNSSNGNNVRILRNGDFPPTAYPLHTSDQTKPFMAPYLDGGGRIKIGPLDAIVMMELTQPESNTNSPGYNLQDMVLLMTCAPKSNNGHGNNIDGVDSSNPGQGKGGPNGQIDPSGTVDDERK
jgi:hypothetical protein